MTWEKLVISENRFNIETKPIPTIRKVGQNILPCLYVKHIKLKTGGRKGRVVIQFPNM